ncbi:MAG TPA: HAMP domain-containing sensor histidine kinase, partial [Luteolibacter sp.]|nr:HAMP domain-containing sensor histidine kinase [Luteolibacter sp.]
PAPKKPAVSKAPVDLVPEAKEKAEEPDPFSPGAVTSNTRPMWIGGELFLMRAVSGAVRSISGSWIDQDKLRTRLLGEVKDLLPASKLIPAKGPSTDGLVLASFPFRLDPGPAPRYHGSLGAPITFSLAAGWGASLIAIIAASLLVFGIMRLSERRASFVSAVTHELRTPLTTFRLYSDMLESNAVKPEKRGDYLRVLSREADRLAHLVENVLAFSRIERGSARSVVSTAGAKDWLEPMKERFEARLATAGMTLEMPLAEPAAVRPVRADAAAIEHILFNLVDNAAKYAAGGEPPVLRISVAETPGRLEIRVRDHGPGIPAAEQRRIFRAFHKSAREAAETRPGVGLGLALSRRLAREMGGDLTHLNSEGGGSVFVLSLPI